MYQSQKKIKTKKPLFYTFPQTCIYKKLKNVAPFAGIKRMQSFHTPEMYIIFWSVNNWPLVISYIKIKVSPKNNNNVADSVQCKIAFLLTPF